MVPRQAQLRAKLESTDWLTKMNKLLEYDHSTQSTNVRDFTGDEVADYDLQKAEQNKVKELIKAQATAKAALLERLGITADEAALLLS